MTYSAPWIDAARGEARNATSSAISFGLGELIASQITLNNKGGELKLVHLTESLRELMAITKVLTVFDICDTEAEALSSFNPFILKVKESQPFFV